MKSRYAVIAAVALVYASQTQAALLTMGFEGLGPLGSESSTTSTASYSEDGMTMSPVGHYDIYDRHSRFPGVTDDITVIIHEGNDGSGLDFTMGGASFDLLSIDITGWFLGTNPSLTGTATFTSSNGGSHTIDDTVLGTIDFSVLSGFSAITSLSIRMPNPGVACVNDSDTYNCPNVGIDQFAFRSPSAVPLPAAAWLFGSALLGLGALKRKKA